MAEYWVVLDKDGSYCPVPSKTASLCKDENKAKTWCITYDKICLDYTPHRVVHLVETTSRSEVDAEAIELVIEHLRGEGALGWVLEPEHAKLAISVLRSWTGEPGPYEPEVVELIQAALELAERIGDPELRLSKALRALKHHQREAAGIP